MESDEDSLLGLGAPKVGYADDLGPATDPLDTGYGESANEAYVVPINVEH